MAFNGFAETGNNVPPNPPYSTFQATMTNAANTTIMDIDSADYDNNLVSYGPGYTDFFNYGGYADGGVGVGVTWTWSVTIVSATLTGGTIAYVVGTPITLPDGSFGITGWTGVGEYVEIQPGRGGGPQPGDNLLIEVIATATNAGGSVNANFIHDINWL